MKSEGFLLILFVAVVFISGCIQEATTSPSAINQEQTAQPKVQYTESTSTNTNAVNTITKTPTEIIPTRAEIPTEFITGKTENLTLNVTGFESGIKLETTKIEGAGVILIDYSVYQFSTPTTAKAYNDEIVNRIKETGGYKEISISDCFAYKEDFGINGVVGESICLKKNIVYIIAGSSLETPKSIDTFMRDGTSTISKKIV